MASAVAAFVTFVPVAVVSFEHIVSLGSCSRQRQLGWDSYSGMCLLYSYSFVDYDYKSSSSIEEAGNCDKLVRGDMWQMRRIFGGGVHQNTQEVEQNKQEVGWSWNKMKVVAFWNKKKKKEEEEEEDQMDYWDWNKKEVVAWCCMGCCYEICRVVGHCSVVPHSFPWRMLPCSEVGSLVLWFFVPSLKFSLVSRNISIKVNGFAQQQYKHAVSELIANPQSYY